MESPFGRLPRIHLKNNAAKQRNRAYRTWLKHSRRRSLSERVPLCRQRHMRLDLKLSTVKRLFALSSNRCAFPKCKQVMVGRHGVLGEICHIEGANPTSARNNPSQTDEQRAAFANLILLCRNHHIESNDESVYTVSVMRKMKANHERQAEKTTPYKAPQWAVKTAIESHIKQLNIAMKGGVQGVTVTGDVHIHQGPDLPTVKSIVLDLIKEKMKTFRSAALVVAKKVSEEVLREFMDALAKEKGIDLTPLASPDVQLSISEALESSARTKWVESRQLLANLLIHRIKKDDEPLAAVVLREAIITVGKLTKNQVRILALYCALVHHIDRSVFTWSDLDGSLNTFVQPFVEVPITKADLWHLDYAGCATFHDHLRNPLSPHIMDHYPWLYAEPLNRNTYGFLGLSERALGPLCEFSADRSMTIKRIPKPEWDRIIDSTQELKAVKSGLDRIFLEFTSRNNANSRKLAERTVLGEAIDRQWTEGLLDAMDLTPVGRAIGVSNIEVSTGKRVEDE